MNKSRKTEKKLLKTQSSVSGSLVHLNLSQLKTEKKYSNAKFPKLSSIQEAKKITIFTKSNNFSSIFVESKRKDYSGYKEYSLKKITNASSSDKQKCIQNSQSQKTNKIDQKDIAKLRKRYSLQPVVLRKKLELLNCICKNINDVKKDPFTECIDSGREHCKSLRSMIKSLKKQLTSERPFISSEQNIEANQNGQNGTNFQRYNLAFNNKPIISVIAQDFGQDISIQRSLIHYKKKAELKLKQRKLFFKDNYTQMKKEKSKQINGDLCGWSNQSFYRQTKANLIESIEVKSK